MLPFFPQYPFFERLLHNFVSDLSSLPLSTTTASKLRQLFASEILYGPPVYKNSVKPSFGPAMGNTNSIRAVAEAQGLLYSAEQLRAVVHIKSLRKPATFIKHKKSWLKVSVFISQTHFVVVDQIGRNRIINVPWRHPSGSIALEIEDPGELKIDVDYTKMMAGEHTGEMTVRIRSSDAELMRDHIASRLP